jgi:hypothetical protein
MTYLFLQTNTAMRYNEIQNLYKHRFVIIKYHN